MGILTIKVEAGCKAGKVNLPEKKPVPPVEPASGIKEMSVSTGLSANYRRRRQET